ncbi:hypothetical protein QYE76_053761 [Lolium multiflorum]|uniref:Transposase (putative) gypsy type domain-containing protein n=1 Tax=Lolium multiflorum TaxID=4521 RepID=A0AAD8WK66_LOLMU|nr:hypothetical protein QYE76_053761 [Lolium multiflorum]
MAAADLGTAQWERSKITNQDINLLKKLGISKKPKAVCFPSEESYPTPPMGYRVSFVDHLIRGLSAPIHPFLRGLLFVYGLQLHHLTPNSILHISIFITLCEAFLGVQPNWALWKRIFFCRRNGSPNVAYNIGGVVISVRSTVNYFDVKLPDSVQGWRKKWLYIREENHGCAEDNIPPFDGAEKILRRRSWDAEATEEERASTEALMTQSRKSAGSKRRVPQATASAQSPPPAVSPKNKSKRNDVEDSGTSKPEEAVPSRQKAAYDPYLETLISSDDEEEVPTADVAARTKKLAEVNERANTLAQKLEQSEEARKKAESDAVQARQEADKAKADAAGVEDLRKRLHDAETSLSEHITAQIAREEAITKRIRTQNRRFVNKTSQEFELEDPDNDALHDAVSFLEFHGTEAREGIDEARTGLSRLFPFFFPKKEEPATFLALAKCFNPPEDLGLKMRHENMKVAVESTVALVADSQQTIDWAKVGDTEQIEQAKWRSLIKAAKFNTKKILSYLGIKPSSTPSSSRPELIFDNYTSTPGLSEVFPSSLPKKTSVTVNFVDDSASKDLTEELEELRGQLQSVKKQSLMLMEQSRKSSERERIALQQAQTTIAEKDSAVAEAAAASSRENSMLQLDASLDMAGSFLDATTEDERVEARSNVLLRLAREHGSNFWGTPERTRQIVRFQDRALQVREYLDFCTRTLSLVYGTMFPRSKMPETLPALMDKFRDAPRIHGFVRAQLAAGARFAMIMVKICYPKLDVGQIVPKCLEKMSKRKRNFGKYDDIVTPVAEDMMDELLRMDSEFFVKGSYAEHSTRAVNNERLTIDNILGNP